MARKKIALIGAGMIGGTLAHLWIVDPILRTLEVYRLEDARWIVASTHGGTDAVRAEPFDAVELRLARWWLEP